MNSTDMLLAVVRPWLQDIDRLLGGPGDAFGGLAEFIICFPLLLSMGWSVSALLRLGMVHFKVGVTRTPATAKPVVRAPSFSVLIPFYGDAAGVLRSVRSLRLLTPAPEAIILIDDGSPPDFDAPDESTLPANVRILRLPRNMGKAAALNHAMRSVQSEVLVCLDADTTARTTDWSSMLSQFTANPKLGAITGKIRPRRVRNLAQLMQAIDYLAVICMVKCAESLWGGLTTVSGAWVAYRRQALIECGGWNPDTSAEDIDLSWRLQAAGWSLHYDFNWTAHVEMARRWGSLWQQRRRWSSGLGRTLREQLGGIFRANASHQAVAFVAVLGCVWIVCSVGMLLLVLVKALSTSVVTGGGGFSLWLHGNHTLIWLSAAAFVIQLLVGILIDRSPFHRYPLMALLALAYPVYFWSMLFTSSIVGLPLGFFHRDGGRWRPTNTLDANLRKQSHVPTVEVKSTEPEENGESAVLAVKVAAPATSSAPDLHQNTAAQLSGAAVLWRQLARLVLMGWSVLCFYVALRMALIVPVSVAAVTLVLAPLAIGAASWMLGCWRRAELQCGTQVSVLQIPAITAHGNEGGSHPGQTIR